MSDSTSQNITKEDEVLQYTQGVRRRVVEQMSDGEKLPINDPKAMATILAALDGMDRSALTQKRIKADENIANHNASAAAAVIAELLQKAGSAGAKPFEVENAAPRPAPELGADVSPPQLVPGEIDVSAPQRNFDEFQTKYQPEEQE